MSLYVRTNSYAGDSVVGHRIDYLGFQAKIIIINCDDAGHEVVLYLEAMGTDKTGYFDALACASNLITSVDNDGFTLGDHAHVNASGKTYIYTAIGGDDVETGSFLGTGIIQSITGAGFLPGLVLTKADAALSWAHKTYAMAGTYSYHYGSAALTADVGISSLDADGFTVGTAANVNESGTTIYWAAIRQVANRLFAELVTGDGTDDRAVTNAGYEPLLLCIKPNDSLWSFRMAGNASAWGGGAQPGVGGVFFSNEIQQTLSTGYELGSTLNVAALELYGWMLASDPINFEITAEAALLTLSAPSASVSYTAPGRRATYKFYVDWDNDGDFGDAGEDISAWVKYAQWSYGRDRASQLTGRCSGGSCGLLLKNRDGEFNRDNTSSAYYGSILPGRRVRIAATYNFVDYTLWQGFLETIQPRIEQGGNHTAELRAVGPLGWIADRKVSVAMQTDITTGAAMGVVLDEIGWAAGDRDIDTGKTTMGRWWTGGKITALYALRQIGDTESGFLRETRDGKIASEDRHFRMSGNQLTSQAEFSDEADADIPYVEIDLVDPLGEIYNIFEASVPRYTVDSLAVIWTLGETPMIAADKSIERWATCAAYADALAVDAWTTPAANTDFTANAAADGSGSDLTANIAIAVSKFDKTMKITLTNNGSTPAYIRGAASAYMQARGTPILEDDPIPITKEDATSQAKYGERTYPNPAAFIPNVAEAEGWCGFNASIYKDPITMLRLELRANRSWRHMTQALSRDLSDRITIVSDNVSKLGLGSEFFIERATHRLNHAGLDHRVTWELSPAGAFGNFWVLDSSALDSTTKLAY